MFTGREFDSETGLYYYRARYYDPKTGRFITRDPIGYAGGMNLYRYCGNNPVNWVDPWGLAPGDPYSTMDVAALAAINDINPESISENREYAGWVYQTPQGDYSYTEPKRGSKVSSSPGKKPNQAKGYYHTHAAYDPNYDNENFSNHNNKGDIPYADSNKVDGYIGTPEGETKKYDYATKEITTIGCAKTK